jgi:hypothetical protein
MGGSLVSTIFFAGLAAAAFGFVFCFSFRDGLPLHVERGVSAAAFERLNVVDDVAVAGAAGVAVGWTRVLAFEGILGRCAALDLPVFVPFD